MILENVNSPADLRALDQTELAQLRDEIRAFIVDAPKVVQPHKSGQLLSSGYQGLI